MDSDYNLSILILEKLIVFQLAKFPTFYRTLKIDACVHSLSARWMNPTHTLTKIKINYFNFILHLCMGFASGILSCILTQLSVCISHLIYLLHIPPSPSLLCTSAFCWRIQSMKLITQFSSAACSVLSCENLILQHTISLS